MFDCSTRCMGKSLNDMLNKGLDLTSSLVRVLLRFREERVDVMAHIESMIHQVGVPDPDSSFLHFLWWEDGNMARKLQEYQMVVHLLESFHHRLAQILHSARQQEIIVTVSLLTSLTQLKEAFMLMIV